jgi:hypothetical protein
MPPLAYFPSRNQYAPETSTDTIAGSSLGVKRWQCKLEPAVCEPERRGSQFFAETRRFSFGQTSLLAPYRSTSGISSSLTPRPAGRSLAAQRSIIVISNNAHAPRNCWCKPKASRDAPDQEPSAQSKPVAITAPTPPMRRHRCTERVRTICATAIIATPDAPRITK